MEGLLIAIERLGRMVAQADNEIARLTQENAALREQVTDQQSEESSS